MEMRYICCYFNGYGYPLEADGFHTLDEAEIFMRNEGYVPTGEQASDAETDGGRILWDGYCDFWTQEGRTLDSYSEGYEPRIRVLHKVGDIEED